MSKILSVEEMRAVEAAADKAGVSYAQMMDNAGRAVADVAINALEVLLVNSDNNHPRVAVLVGPGNNGGDGLVAGRLIAEETPARVSFFLTRPRDESDHNFAKVKAAGLQVIDAADDKEYSALAELVASADIVIDALLGTGTKLPLRGDMAKILKTVHQALDAREAERPRPRYSTPTSVPFGPETRPTLISVDIPTGMNADTGELDKNALYADDTVTFEGPRPGHLKFPGAEAAGTLHIAPLHLPDALKPRDKIQRELVDASMVRRLLPPRPANSNKGTFGKAMIVAGSANYMGAPVMAARSAYRTGAGLVTVAAPESIVGTLAAHILETTWLHLPDDLGVIKESAVEVVRRGVAGYTAMLVGPGLNKEEPTRQFMAALFPPRDATGSVETTRRIGFATTSATSTTKPGVSELPRLVVDADGLNMLAQMPEWWTRLPSRTVLTPHVGEMGRLSAIQTSEQVQADRWGLATEKAQLWNCVVVLKGAFTVIADPDGRVAVMPFANPALARAGTGDVLAGMIVGFLAQGLDPFDAAVAGAFIHGYAGELAAVYVGTRSSVLATDVLAALPDAISGVETAW